MDSNLIFLILAFLIIFIIIAIIIYNILHGHINNNNNNVLSPCQIQISKLANITNVPNCNNVEGNVSPFKYLCPGTNFPLTASVSTIQTPYIEACKGFCTSGNLDSNGNCLDQNNANYTTCINLTKPNNCNSLALPVAYDTTGNNYYINYAGSGICNNVQCHNF